MPSTSDSLVDLTPDEIKKLEDAKLGIGCAGVIAGFFLVVGVAASFFLHYSLEVWIAYAAVAGVIVGAYFLLRWWTNGRIDRDLAAGKKRVIISPITDKQIDTHEIKNNYSRRRGQIDSKYRMTVGGSEWKMSESDYLEIRKGEIVEIHVAPNSDTVFSKRWLRSDGTSRDLT